MNNTYFVIIEYIIGWLVYVCWFITSPKGLEEYKKDIGKDPQLAIIPEGFIRAITFILVLILSIPWPYYIIRRTVLLFYRLIFGKKGSTT